MTKVIDNIDVDKLCVVDSLVWSQHRKLMLNDGVRFELVGRPYLVGPVGCERRCVSIKKGSQVGITTAKFLEAVHRCYYRIYPQNIIYMLPTIRQAEVLSKVSFGPIFRNNGWLNKVVSNDSAGLKTVNGRSIVFVGSQSDDAGNVGAKDSINLRSIPADCVYRDEIDMMDEDMVEFSKQRLNASDFRHECNFGSPRVPGYGIDQLYDDGTQNLWMVRCSCGKYTSLVQEFPKSIRKVGDRWVRSCVHCGAEVFVENGKWIPQNEKARNASYWVDGLINRKADLEGYMFRYYNSDGSKLAEFNRSILGLATVEGTNQLSIQDVFACCRQDGMSAYSSDKTVIGIDVGEVLHYTIGYRTGRESYKILTLGETREFGQLRDICLKMNVRMGVIDKGPDIHGVKEFVKNCGFPLFRCQYSETMPGKPVFDDGIVKCNRNEMCDKTHAVFMDKMITIPRRSTQVDDFAVQLTKMMKDTVKHPDTGIPKTRWVKVGNKEDHYFHSTLYFLLASSRVGSVVSGQTKKVKIISDYARC